MTLKGAQRVLDYRVFKHNFGTFPRYIRSFRNKYRRYHMILQESGRDPSIRGQGNHFKRMLRNLDTWYENYQRVWTQYFAII
ncbi:MAG: hypothetical protein JXA99_17640 [Candidatus Lokiarchaeota archaeon]|nr:hypothetical protein [Candidatus Lokiarchaeota archaeon]